MPATITYHFIQAQPFFDFFQQQRSSIFKADFDFDIRPILSEQEKLQSQQHQQVLKNITRYFLVAKANEAIVGWSFGMQKSAEDFYMINSAVLAAYRQQGIYTQLMQHAVEFISNKGFQRIYSRHKMSNNAILIPKLKFGFTITGFEVNDVFGNLVELSFYTNPQRRALLEIRMGTRKPNATDLQLIQ